MNFIVTYISAVLIILLILRRIIVKESFLKWLLRKPSDESLKIKTKPPKGGQGKKKGELNMDLFDRLNRETFSHNNGISRNINPTSSCGRIKASDLLANYNNYTYKANNGQYTKHYF